MKIRNISDERQAVHTTTGVVFIHPGKTRDVELSEAGEKLVLASSDLRTYATTAQKVPRKPKDAPEHSESVDVHSEDQTQSAGQFEDGSGEA